MPRLTLDLDALQVQSFSPDGDDGPRAEMIATANTCYRTCYATHCFC